MNVTSQQWIYIGSGVASAVAIGVLGYNIYLSRTAPPPVGQPAPAVSAAAPKAAPKPAQGGPDAASGPAATKAPLSGDSGKTATQIAAARSANPSANPSISPSASPSANPGASPAVNPGSGSAPSGTLGNIAKALSPAKPSGDPEFDLVRVEPSGDTVVAGRAQPGEEVSLLNKGKQVGKAKANSSGEFVIIPDRLAPGAHRLTLKAGSNGKDRQSRQNVAVAVPEKGNKEVIVALAEPDKPTVILSDPKTRIQDFQAPSSQAPNSQAPVSADQNPARPASAPAGASPADAPAGTAIAARPDSTNPGDNPQAPRQATPKSPLHAALPGKPDAAQNPAAPAPVVLFRTVEAQQGGGFFASGTATPGSLIRIYLNNAFLADVQAGSDGRWSLRIGKGLTAGKYVVRADVIEQGSARVAARAEVPFEYSPAIAAAPRTPSPAPTGQPASGANEPANDRASKPASKSASGPASEPASASKVVQAESDPAGSGPQAALQAGANSGNAANPGDAKASGNAKPAGAGTVKRTTSAPPAGVVAKADVPDASRSTAASTPASTPGTTPASTSAASTPDKPAPDAAARTGSPASTSASGPDGSSPATQANGGAAPAPATAAPASRSPPADAATPVRTAATPGTPAAPADARGQQPPPAHVVIERLSTRNVVKGDSLWRISRQIYGRGIRYTQIYAANTDQIRNPHLIYPGQVLVVPVGKPEPANAPEKASEKPGASQ